MASFTSTTELKKMALTELKRESAELKRHAAKLRLGIEMQKEKNHGLYRRMRRQIARIETVITVVGANGLKDSAKVATLSAPETSAKKSATKTKKPKSTSTPRS